MYRKHYFLSEIKFNFLLAELLIIADDITGAIEAGVQLSKRHIASRVVLHPNSGLESVFSKKQITAVVVNSESRHLSPAEAAEKIQYVVQITRGWGIKWFYKKTDSTLRGNIGAELEKFLLETKQVTLPYIPGHPKLKRFTRQGFQYIEETLLHETNFANDPLEPVTSSFIPEVLKKQSNLEILLFPAEGISESEILSSKKEKIVVFDCSTVTDLKTIGKYLVRKNWLKAMAGTAAMVEILPEILPLNSSELTDENPVGPVLMINGSLNEISLQQVKYARIIGVTTFVISQQLLADSIQEMDIEFQNFTQKIKSALKGGEDVIISTSGFNNQKVMEPFGTKKPDKKYFHAVPKRIGQMVAEILKENSFTTLCVFGGDTLNGILNALGAESIEPNRELFPGVAVASVFGTFGKIHLITKPGGYGEKDEILKILNQINKSAV
jgi:D-threonate/D-erythronate kinase